MDVEDEEWWAPVRGISEGSRARPGLYECSIASIKDAWRIAVTYGSRAGGGEGGV